MKIEKGMMVLYAISILKGDPSDSKVYTKDHLASALGISPNTLDLYLTKLNGNGEIVRIKKKYVRDSRRTTEITQKGSATLRDIQGTIDNLLLTEERHNIPSCMELSTILARIPDPLEKVFFLALYNQNKYFDLPMFLNTLRLSKEETNILNIFCDLDPNPCGTRSESFAESFFNASLYGNIDKELLDADLWRKEDIDALMILAQAKTRMGRFEDAKMIHEHLLSSRTDLTQNQWFTIKMDQAMMFIKAGDMERARGLLETVLPSIENKVYIAFARMVKAFVMFYLGDKERSNELFRSSIGSFSTFGLPLFLSLAHNYRGVCAFMDDDFTAAERNWTKARKYAREAKSEFAEAKILPNLAHIAMKKEKFELARTLLKRSYDIFRSYHDYEGMAVVEFNMALLKIDTGDLEGALDHFRRCREVAFPLPSQMHLDIYRGDIIKHAKLKGFENIESLI